ncbi:MULTISPECIES: HAD family hydrolase [Streptomyces]|uniref:HAD family hydrolase n=1 Tax=Streptomyces TaxID=1883 RepID=UPI0004AB09AD|nr:MULTISPECIES: HAD-IB family hydrolase [Streptomyces]
MTPPRRGPADAGYLVFADVDETVIRCRSPLEFLDHYFAERHGQAGRRYAAAVRADLDAAVAAGSSRDEANRRYYAAWRGERLADVRRSGRDWYLRRREEHGFFIGETVDALHRHRAASAEVALVSGSFAALLHPLAEELGATHVLAAEPATERGVLTGELVGPPMIGEGKRRAVRALLASRPAVDPGDCHAYGDHVSDLPMLQEVGHPTIVGGSPELLALLPRANRLGVWVGV